MVSHHNLKLAAATLACISLLTPKMACQLPATKQPAQILQTAFGKNVEYFCFLRYLLDKEQVNTTSTFFLLLFYLANAYQ